MPTIWTFGDSFTFGDGCRPDKGIIKSELEYYVEYYTEGLDIWPNILGKRSGYDVKNLSRSGASNDFILDSVMNAFNLFQPEDIVIISKTFFARFDIPGKSRFNTIYAESLYGIQVCLDSKNLTEDKVEKETILNYGVLYASDPLVRERQDLRFNFVKNVVSNKVSKTYLWDADSDFRKTFTNIQQHSNGKYDDYHFSFLGHIEFAEALHKLLFSKRNLL